MRDLGREGQVIKREKKRGRQGERINDKICRVSSLGMLDEGLKDRGARDRGRERGKEKEREEGI
jgi:hypothetical protein